MSKRREFIGRLIVAGPTRTVTGEAGGYVVTAAAIREAVAAGLFRGLACFADHAVGGASSVRRLLGVWRDVVYDEAAGAAVGHLAAYETDETRPVLDLLDQWLADGDGEKGGTEAGERPDVGISIVFYPRLAADGRTVTGMVMVESADVVMFPASAGSRVVGRLTSDELRMTNEEGDVGEVCRVYSHSDYILRGEATHPARSGVRRARLQSREGGETVLERQRTNGDAVHRAVRRGRLRSLDTQETALKRLTTNLKQECNEMTQQTELAGAPRVALVRGSDGERPTAAGGQPTPDGGGHEGDGWLDALKTAAATAVIRASGLPGPVQERLGAGRYETADDVHAAVERARAELAALNEAGIVRLGGMGSPEHGRLESGRLRLRDGLDEARELVGFFFGAAGAPTPPPNLRSFADLYVALTGDVHFRGVFDGGRVLFSGATTSTLPNLAVDAMNRVIVQQFAALDHYRWYERVTDVAPNDGRLHDMKWITLGGIGNLPAVAEGAAYTELSVADAQETASFVKRGGYVGITREMIKNGDLMQLQAIPRALAAAAVRTRSAAVSALFTANSGVGPTLAQDSKALFHADHANLATTALGTDAAAWRAARSECFQQVELGSSKPLGIFPRFLLVPAELYDTALSILGYGEGMPAVYTPEAQGRGFADPRPVPLVVPDWTDATDWAYIVDPALFPVIQMSYSQAPGGRQHPIPELFAVVSETSGLMFSNDVLPIKVRDEFAVGVNGPRGIGKRNVA